MLRSILIIVIFMVAAGVHNYLFGNNHHFLAVGIYNGVIFGLGGLFWRKRND